MDNFYSSSRSKHYLSFFLTLLILLVLPLTVFLAKQQQDIRQRAQVASPSIPDRERRFLENFVNATPVLTGVDPARAAGNRAIALAYLGRYAEAKNLITTYIGQVNNALSAYNMGLAVYLVGSELSAAEQQSVKDKIVAIIDNPNLVPAAPDSRVSCDTGAERNAWNAALLALAANFYPIDSRASQWEGKAKLFAFHALTQAPGETSGGVTTANVDASYVMDNHDAHGNLHYAYAGSIGELGMGAFTYLLKGKAVPVEFQHNVLAVYDAHKQFFNQTNYQYQNWTSCSGGMTSLVPNGRDNYGGDATWNNSAFAYAGYLSGNYTDLDNVTTHEYSVNNSQLSIGVQSCAGFSYCPPVTPDYQYLFYSIIAKRSAISALIYNPTPTPTPPSPSVELAHMVSPTPGSILPSSTVNFSWSSGSGATQYWLRVSTVVPGGGDLYDQGQGTSLSTTVTGVPTTQTIYVRLWSLVSVAWHYCDYLYGPGSSSSETCSLLPSPTPTPTLTPTPTPLPPSPTPSVLTISGVSVTNITGTSAIINWTTSGPGTSQVKYATSNINLYLSSVLDSNLKTTHTVTLTGLSRNRTYYYRVYSRNAAGAEFSSSTQSFRTAR